ncbi:MAG: PucC family protein [Candidatus Saccharibacteria bacterium]|nr:PucC family protein [Pseudorhodobacter sp.]
MILLKPKNIQALGTRWMPFADAVSEGLSFAELLRLSLFQVSVGMAAVLLLGTLNRVMIVELAIPATIVALMIALPVISAPFRAMLGHKSDNHKSWIGWKRVPYLWFGSLWQMGGLAIMPFALIVLSGDQIHGPAWAGHVLAALAFLMTGIGMHMTQTAGLALASDRASPETRPRVVAFLYVMNLLGMAVSAVILGLLLRDYDDIKLIRVVQGCGVVTMVLNLVALWRQEKVRPMSADEMNEVRPIFHEGWRDLMAGGQAGRLLLVVMLGTMGFQMQDVLLEPYGAQILGLSVSATTWLTACNAMGALVGFVLAGRWMTQGHDMFRMSARGLLVGMVAFLMVIFAAPVHSTALFFAGAWCIGLGAGLFIVSTLTAAMSLPEQGKAGRGLVLGAWGAAQATAAGLSIALGGGLRDVMDDYAMTGHLGPIFATPTFGYSFVYQIEILVLFGTLIALAPLVRVSLFNAQNKANAARLGLVDFPN